MVTTYWVLIPSLLIIGEWWHTN